MESKLNEEIISVLEQIEQSIVSDLETVISKKCCEAGINFKHFDRNLITKHIAEKLYTDAFCKYSTVTRKPILRLTDLSKLIYGYESYNTPFNYLSEFEYRKLVKQGIDILCDRPTPYEIFAFCDLLVGNMNYMELKDTSNRDKINKESISYIPRTYFEKCVKLAIEFYKKTALDYVEVPNGSRDKILRKVKELEANRDLILKKYY